MNILQIISSNAEVHGGPTRALALIEGELLRLGVHVETATTDDAGRALHNGKSLGEPLFENGVYRWYFRKQTETYKVSIGLAWWIYKNLKRFDLVHIHGLFSFSSLISTWCARFFHIPYIIRPLGTLNTYGLTQRRPWLKKISLALIERPSLRNAAAVHFTSFDEQRDAMDLGVPMNAVIIPIGMMSFTPCSSSLVRCRFSILSEAPYLLFIGRLNPVKNVDGLLRAFGLLISRFPDLKLLIGGDGDFEYVDTLKKLSADLGLGNRIVWAGHIEGKLKISALSGAIAFVLPSFSENFGIAAAEALRAGLPCVLGRGVGIAQDVVGAGAGVAVSTDPNGIANGITQVLADIRARAEMSTRASALAKDKYTAQAMGARLVQLYYGILKL
jgi:glycosyltransferase involved in cell wall biosynthesis